MSLLLNVGGHAPCCLQICDWLCMQLILYVEVLILGLGTYSGLSLCDVILLCLNRTHMLQVFVYVLYFGL